MNDSNVSSQRVTEVRNKLQMRMIMRMSEKFGGNSNSLRVIKDCLDEKLEGKVFINPAVSITFL